jgi:hypothetical protein
MNDRTQYITGMQQQHLLYTISLKGIHSLSRQNIEKMTELVRLDLTDIKRLVIVALVTVDVHARDIIEELRND